MSGPPLGPPSDPDWVDPDRVDPDWVEPTWTPTSGPPRFGDVHPPPELEATSSETSPVVSAERELLGTPTRQAPLAVVFIAWRFFRNLGAVNLGLFAVFLLSGRVPFVVIGAGFGVVVLALVVTLVGWWRFVFQVDGDELLVRKGAVQQERLTIPFDRVQSVSIDQKLLHRLVGLVSVSVDTAGSSGVEFQIDAVDRAKAEALQRLLAGRGRSASEPTLDPVTGVATAAGGDGPAVGSSPAEAGLDFDPSSVVVHRTLGDLVRAGLTAWPWTGLVVLASLFTVADDLQRLVPFSIEEEDLVGVGGVEVGPGAILSIIGLVILLLVAVTMLGALLQVGREILSHWDLKLVRTSTGLRRTAGLLSTTSKASTVIRIQGVQTDDTPAQRLLGITRVTLPTVGDGDLMIPAATEEDLVRIREIVFERPDPPLLDRSISRKYIFLELRNTAIMLTIGIIAAFVAFGDWRVVAAYVVLIPRWLEVRRRWRLRRWGISGTQLSESYQFLNRHTAELDLIKTQSASVTRSFFERRRGLATVRVETAEGFLAVPLIPLAEAQAVRDRALHAAESQHRAWM